MLCIWSCSVPPHDVSSLKGAAFFFSSMSRSGRGGVACSSFCSPFSPASDASLEEPALDSGEPDKALIKSKLTLQLKLGPLHSKSQSSPLWIIHDL